MPAVSLMDILQNAQTQGLPGYTQAPGGPTSGAVGDYLFSVLQQNQLQQNQLNPSTTSPDNGLAAASENYLLSLLQSRGQYQQAMTQRQQPAQTLQIRPDSTATSDNQSGGVVGGMSNRGGGGPGTYSTGNSYGGGPGTGFRG